MMDTPSAPLRCATHPETETYLRCGRCGTPICPRCLVYTPVGTRCRTCARLRRLPTYEVNAAMHLRAAAVGLALALGFGILWGLATRFGLGAGFFTLWIVLFLGFGCGELIALAVNRKRGPGLMAIAAASVVLAFSISRLLPLAGMLLVVGAPVELVLATLGRLAPAALLDPISLLFVALGAALAASRLR
jgi:hypothetical protein